MIKELPMYTVLCDNCKVDANEGCEYSAWADKDYATDCAMDADWHKTDDDKHICPDCFLGYDEDDNVIIKPTT